MGNDATVLQSLQQITNWGILTTDADLTVTSANAWFVTNSGRPAGEIVGNNLLTIFPEVAARNLDDRFRQVLTGSTAVLSQRLHGYLFSMPSRISGGHATQMQQSVQIAPLLNDGQVVGTLTVVEDVTERVQFETSLRESALHHAIIADLAQQALAGGNRAGLLEQVVAKISGAIQVPYCGIFELRSDKQAMVLRAGSGWPEGDVGSACLDAGPESLGAEVFERSEPLLFSNALDEPSLRQPKFFQQRKFVCGITIAVRGGNGWFGAIGMYSDRPYDFQQDDIHFLEATANILGMAIERMHLEDTLRMRVEQLAMADQRKNEFLAMLAHELRNPLAPIESAIQILRLKGSQDQEVQWARDVIERQSRQMTRLVNDLLDVSRITTGKIKLQTEPVELQRLVDAATEISRPVIEAHRHRFTISIDPNPLWLEGDRPRLVQALSNILNNAAKYTPDGGQITLTAGQENGEIVIRVRDSGIGIPTAMLPSIFDLFTQVDRSLDRSEGGLGIGLTLVRKIMELHGGSVHVSSAGRDCGSEFTLRLPAVPGEERATAKQVLGPSRVSFARPRKIVVVDDNADCARTLAMLLKMLGSPAATVFSSIEALQTIESDPPDLVFMDIGLPGMDGHELARCLRENARLDACYLVAISGYGRETDIRNSVAAGFDHHLVKPVTLESLLELLDRLPAARGAAGGGATFQPSASPANSK
jgi:signal transduction histidine kinase/ActR/RegA family two-component response regulator